MTMRCLMPFVGALALSACSSGSSDPFPSPSVVAGNPDAREVLLQDGGGYRYSALIDSTGTASTDARLLPGLSLDTPLPGGTATFDGRFDMTRISEISGAMGTTEQISGPLTLSVDFANNRVTTDTGDLLVDAQISGSDLSGTVSFETVEGTMAGAIDPSQAIGVFAHESPETIYAGGFYASDSN